MSAGPRGPGRLLSRRSSKVSAPGARVPPPPATPREHALEGAPNGAGAAPLVGSAGRALPQRSGGLGRQAARVFAQNRLALLSVAFVILMVLFCFVGPLVYRTDQIDTNLLRVHLAPGGSHPLGTDAVGYDELGRLMVGGQSSLEVGLAAAVVASTWGVLWGAVAGYFGGLVDTVMMRVVDSILAIPSIFLLLFLASVFTPSVVMLVFVVALVSWLIPARLVRAETLSLRVRDYVQAVRGMGARPWRIVGRHIVPNAIGTIVVYATFSVADAILLVAALSYLGLGVPPPAANWGSMLSNGLNYVSNGWWWLIYPPGIAIVAVVVAFNFIGDALRDALEVRARRSAG